MDDIWADGYRLACVNSPTSVDAVKGDENGNLLTVSKYVEPDYRIAISRQAPVLH